MSNAESCKLVFGAAGPLWREKAPEVVKMLREAGITEIDVAQVYLDSERTAGEVGAGRYFSIGTKELGCGGLIVGDGPPTRENVIRRALHSLDLLKVDQVDTFYIHGPDRATPFEDTLEGMNELYKMGTFKRFGLSNFLPDEVEKVSWYPKSGTTVATTWSQRVFQLTRSEKDCPHLPRKGIRAPNSLRRQLQSHCPKAGDAVVSHAEGTWHHLLCLLASSRWVSGKVQGGHPRQEMPQI